MTNFPNSLDNFTNPTEFDQINSATVRLDTQLSNLNDAVEAIEAFLINGTLGTATGDWRLRLTGGVLVLEGKNGANWHKLYIETVEGSVRLQLNQTPS